MVTLLDEDRIFIFIIKIDVIYLNYNIYFYAPSVIVKYTVQCFFLFLFLTSPCWLLFGKKYNVNSEISSSKPLL